MNYSDALWNEVVRIINKEFVENGQPLTPDILKDLIKYIADVLTD